MRDFLQMKLFIIAPAALAILGAIWLLKRKSDKNKKANESKKEPSEKENVTQSQRKAPETLARDRGDSDIIGAPDCTAGTRSESNDIEKKDQTPKLNRSPPMPVPGVKEVILEDQIETVVGAAPLATGDTFSSPDMSETRRVVFEPTDAAVSEPSGKLNRRASQFAADFVDTNESNIEDSTDRNANKLSQNCISVSDAKCDSANNGVSDSNLNCENEEACKELSEAASNEIVNKALPVSDLHEKSVLEEQETGVNPCNTHPNCDKPFPPQIVSSPPSKVKSLELACSIDSGSVMDEDRRLQSSSPASESADSAAKRVRQFSSSASQDSVVGSLEEGRGSSLTSPVPDDCACSVQEKITNRPEESRSPGNSEGSNDSGQGGSELDSATVLREPILTFRFNIPSGLVGRLIGRQGRNISAIKNASNAEVTIHRDHTLNEVQVCTVIGTESEVNECLEMIRDKFPIEEHPDFTMLPLLPNISPNALELPVVVPDHMQMSLPEGVTVEVIVSSLVNTDHVFLQQPTHQSFMGLQQLSGYINMVYSQSPEIPVLPSPVKCGDICVVNSEGMWYRAVVIREQEEGYCEVKFVDYGGYAQMPVEMLKQIRMDCLSVPFQAVECYMANIMPANNATSFNETSLMSLNELTQQKVLQCQVVGRSEEGIPFVHLYDVNQSTSSAVLVNQSLVELGHAQWVELL